MPTATSPVKWISDADWAELPIRLRALVIASTQVGVREATGRNDGPRVREYLKAVGLGEGYAWCNAFVAWAYAQAGYKGHPFVFSAGVRVTRDRATNSKCLVKMPERGDLFLWVNPNGTGHIGFVAQVEKKLTGTYLTTIEGNTDGDGTREGNGVYRKSRRLGSSFRFVRVPG